MCKFDVVFVSRGTLHLSRIKLAVSYCEKVRAELSDNHSRFVDNSITRKVI